MNDRTDPLYRLLSNHRRSIAVAIYAGLALVAYVAAFLLRFEFAVPAEYITTLLLTVPLLVAIRVAGALVFRLAGSRWRFVGTHDVVRLVAAIGAGSVVFLAAVRLLPLRPPVPNSVVLLEALLSCLLVAGAWIGYRLAFEWLRLRRAMGRGPTRRVLLVGAGEAGSMLAREMTRYPTGYTPVGFVDDDPSKWGASLHGLDVIGGTVDLPAIVAAVRADELILAVPSAQPAELRRLVELSERVELPFKVLPGIKQVLEGDVRLNQLRRVRIEDLLGREPVELELPELAADLRGRCVLITGAAGSIGSELARQVALHEPGRLVLLDQAETGLFYLELELRQGHPGLPIRTIVGDVVNAAVIERIFLQERPERVFHAAAYKHVPMMEANPAEAVRNNVVGTWVVAQAAGRHGAARFVLISTDKAVRPANVMGATKRLAELTVLELQAAFPGTAYTAVRFGNVLGSAGSVLPIFKRQLAAGGPLTVTHPDVTRYFMTIPEAVQLILQAAVAPEVQGRIAMLDMGEPVRIMELARNLIRLTANGHPRPEIVCIGLRPGEKLHEELVAPDEDTVTTSLPKVRVVLTPRCRGPRLLPLMAGLQQALARGDDDHLEQALAAVFPEVPAGGPDLAGPAASNGSRRAPERPISRP
jgi:FlaA1/EpsC-like NDP-sugar epimerase